MPEALLTSSDLAERWSKPLSWVTSAARAGRIPAIKIGQHWRFSMDDVTAYEERNKNADPLRLSAGAAARRKARR